MLRSPMVTRNFLLPTAGKRNTCTMASPTSMPRSSSVHLGATSRCAVATRRVVCGGLPSSVPKAMSTGVSRSSGSSTVNCCCMVASPTTA